MHEINTKLPFLPSKISLVLREVEEKLRLVQKIKKRAVANRRFRSLQECYRHTGGTPLLKLLKRDCSGIQGQNLLHLLYLQFPFLKIQQK